MMEEKKLACDYDPRTLIENYLDNSNRIAIVKTLKVLSMKEVYVHFLEHLN